MKKVICDVCKEREADHNFKVKYNIRGWHHIDICRACLDMLMEIRREAQNECAHKENRS